MHASTLIVYTTAAFAGAMIPGPTSLLALTNGISGNWRVVLASMFGAACSDIVVIAAVGLGLGALLTASATLFTIIKSIGVVYLLWLALQLWNSQPMMLKTSEMTDKPGMSRAFTRSFGVALTNPKVLLFFSAFLPQFVDATQPLVPQYTILAFTSAGIDIFVMTIYASCGGHIARVLTITGLRRLNRVCAAIMSCFGIFLTFYRRSGEH